MPAKRLPWYKVWVGTSRHAKVVGLSDRSFRIWHELLDAASEQKVRGRFDSLDTAARVVRRSIKELLPLLQAGLLDECEDGTWLHDWKDWQRWRPEDAVNDDGLPPDHPPNDTRSTHDQHTIVNGRTHEEHANVNGTTIDQHANVTRTTHEDPSRGAERAKTEKETEKENLTAAHARTTVIDDSFAEDLEEQFWEAFGSREAVRDSIAAALGYKKRSNYTDQRAFLRNWVRGDAERSQNRRGSARVVPIRRAAPRLGVRHA